VNAELTVRELCRYSHLDIGIAAGGPGLDRAVRWAHSTELLDPRPYLHGGELVLTVGSGLTDEERCAAFVHALAECRVAALGLGIGDVHNEPPPALVAGCEEAGVPLLLVPPSTPFIEITELLAEHRIRQASARSRRATVGRLLTAVVKHQASPDLLRDDLADAGLPAEGLVASLWSVNVDDGLERRFSSRPHLLGDLPSGAVLLTAGREGPEQLAANLGVPCQLSEPFDLDDLASALAELIDRWSRPAPEQEGADAGPHRRPRLQSHYTYLVHSLPEETLVPLLADLMDPLLEHDEAGGAHLLESLETFLEHDGSVQAAARTMHLHPNSLRHRLTRVYEITGRNPLLFRDQVDFAIALQALHRRQHGQPA
jgi:hypothetical protein